MDWPRVVLFTIGRDIAGEKGTARIEKEPVFLYILHARHSFNLPFCILKAVPSVGVRLVGHREVEGTPTAPLDMFDPF
jgi:hypothetical protein